MNGLRLGINLEVTAQLILDQTVRDVKSVVDH